MSKMGDTILVRPAEVRQYGDAFDVVYQGLNKKKCRGYVQTFFPQSYTVLVGSTQEQVQDTLGSREDRLISDPLITDACNAPEFSTNMGVVVFRFVEPMAVGSGAIDPTCAQLLTETQNLACPGGQIGAIVQKRFTECSGPFAAPTYGAWVEVSRSCRIVCAANGNCCQLLPDQTRPFSCSAGFFGIDTERRTSWCDAANPDTGFAPNWNPWVFNTGTPCTACPAPSTATETRWTAQTGACAAGEYGSTGWEREEVRSQTTTYNCPAGTTALPAPSIFMDRLACDGRYTQPYRLLHGVSCAKQLNSDAMGGECRRMSNWRGRNQHLGARANTYAF